MVLSLGRKYMLMQLLTIQPYVILIETLESHYGTVYFHGLNAFQTCDEDLSYFLGART
jgi:hypothetical protein